MLIPVAVVNESAPVTPFTPTDIAGLVAWYDASDTATITDAGGGAVSAWADKSGNGYTLTEATNRPTTGTRSQNGLNVIDFDGLNDKLSSSCPADDITVTTIVVAMVDNITDYHTMTGADGDGGECLRTNQTTGQLQLESQALTTLLTAQDVTASVPFIVTSALGGTTFVQIFAGIRTVGAGTPGGFGGFTGGRTLVVGASNTTFFHDGWIGEIIRYNSTLSLGNTCLVMDYLGDKWGIAF